MNLGVSMFMLIMMALRTLAVPFSSSLGSTPVVIGIPTAVTTTSLASTITNELPTNSSEPPGYSPTLPPLEITVFPSSQASQTVTVTQPALTVTITSPPETVVTTVIASQTSILPSSASPVLATSSLVPSETAPRPTEWSLPSRFTSIDEAFNIEHYAFGRDNVQLASMNQGAAAMPGKGSTAGVDQTILQITYPRGSYSPSHEPRGGTDFYATPSFATSGQPRIALGATEQLYSLRSANNVTLSYSVYFPPAFDFVKGGKLPGLYGGHERCSGGDDGLGCFSTRLMWRGSGKGELYLYAPKDRQPQSLCSTPPRSTCDSAYGLSIGRGSFIFERGVWTHVSQTVWLNTPGRANGGFILQVGHDDDTSSLKTVMSSAEVFYRDVHGANDDIKSASIDDIYGEEDEPGRPAYEASNDWNPVQNVLSLAPIASSQSSSLLIAGVAKATVYVVQGTHTATVPNYQTVTLTKTIDGGATAPASINEQAGNDNVSLRDSPVGFIGIFFSTFFGGSTPDWASPKDQSACFTNFKVAINA